MRNARSSSFCTALPKSTQLTQLRQNGSNKDKINIVVIRHQLWHARLQTWEDFGPCAAHVFPSPSAATIRAHYCDHLMHAAGRRYVFLIARCSQPWVMVYTLGKLDTGCRGAERALIIMGKQTPKAKHRSLHSDGSLAALIGLINLCCTIGKKWEKLAPCRYLMH